ncbi:MAG: hypothetical protein CVU38_12190 [Chloroflexi bacterium HGW-Chloroflexi-1]|nr:MAG: hypothetical protein CVU38_12190 [Chloroflexi bacterium HGW-Chloroflexi-1]
MSVSSYAYLDESGALPDGPGYFVIAILLTHHPRSLQKIIRTAREKMKSSQKGHRQTQELKFHNASRGNAVYWEIFASCIAVERVVKWP